MYILVNMLFNFYSKHLNCKNRVLIDEEYSQSVPKRND